LTNYTMALPKRSMNSLNLNTFYNIYSMQHVEEFLLFFEFATFNFFYQISFTIGGMHIKDASRMLASKSICRRDLNFENSQGGVLDEFKIYKLRLFLYVIEKNRHFINSIK